TIAAFAGTLRESPTALAEMLLAVDHRLAAPKEVVLVAAASRAELAPFVAELRGHFVPGNHLVMAVEGADLDAQAALVPFARERRALDGKATAYVCENRVCELPTHDAKAFAVQLSRR
ncbi:MAG: thioredoxin domain-containing protein, partial [Verrucomicrobiae bacterium]|nr:thioredoxin domain-containing protein [Verrucomicrobiae bacterium]